MQGQRDGRSTVENEEKSRFQDGPLEILADALPDEVKDLASSAAQRRIWLSCYWFCLLMMGLSKRAEGLFLLAFLAAIAVTLWGVGEACAHRMETAEEETG